MSKLKVFRSLAEANKANRLYQQAEEEWRKGKLQAAFRLFLAAARMGMVEAFSIAGQFYDRGEGVRANPEAALLWYRRAFRHGDALAANNIGCIWRDRGKLRRAISWFERAVKLGDIDANLEIAKIHVTKRRQLSKAIGYLNKTRRSPWVTEGSREEARDLIRKLRGKKKRASKDAQEQ
jgi:TPR repeat protein